MIPLATVFEGQFFSGGHLRWNLGWPTPNYAGAFLVTLLPLWWILNSNRWRWPALLGEAVGLLLLAKTYSRGAVVAWMAAWLFGFLALRGWQRPIPRVLWALRAGLLALGLLASDFGWHRVPAGRDHGTPLRPALSVDALRDGYPDEDVGITEDRSVGNRLAIWRGGLSMIASAPTSGWGAGESGRAYMNWFQPSDRTEVYVGMVNSYLSVATERGLPLLGVIACAFAWLLELAWRGARQAVAATPGNETSLLPALFTAAGSSLTAWAVASVFTNLWIEPGLWIVPILAAAVVLGAGLASTPKPPWLRISATGGIYTLLIVVGLYGCGSWLAAKQRWQITPDREGTVTVASRHENAGTGKSIWHIWPDTSVFGAAPGKELRRWIASWPAGTVMVIHGPAPHPGGRDRGPAEGLVLCGRQVDRLGREALPRSNQLWLIHPLGIPPAPTTESDCATHSAQSRNADHPRLTVVLPAIDEAGLGLLWRQWAERHEALVLVSKGTGQDIRMVWPAIVANLDPG